jgi:hypothetical protein
MFAAILLIVLLSAAALASTVGTIQSVARDGYRAIPTRSEGAVR